MAAAVEIKKKLTLSDLAPSAIDIYLEHPKIGKLDVSIQMVGPDSDQFIQVGKSVYKKRGAKSEDDMTADDLIIEAVDLLAQLTTGWSDDEFFGVEYSKENMRKVLNEHRWIREQLQVALEDRKRFFTM